MRTYIATHKQTELKIIFKYDDFGNLVGTELTGDRWTDEQVEWFYKKFSLPLKISQMWELCENKKSQFEFIEKPTDLSFKYFWNLYAYKKGNSLKAEEKWKKLSDEEKVDVLLFIPKYKAQKQLEGTALKYPEFFLSSKAWLAEKI